MASLVLELQQDALNPRVAVSDILRKALVVARKLGLHELEQWMQSELNGYGDTPAKQIPEYRQIRGQVRALNPYRGWQPVVFENAEMERLISTKSCSQSVAEIEHLLSSAKGGGTLTMEFTDSQQVELARAIHANLETTLMIQPANLSRILDAVRNTILEWTLKLEQDGIRGEGMSFTPEEKRRVADHGSYNINIFGSVHGSQIQQATDSSVQVQNTGIDLQALREFVAAVRERVDMLPLGSEQKAELDAEIGTVETQLRSPKPKATVLREALRSVRALLEGVASSTIATELLKLLTHSQTGLF